MTQQAKKYRCIKPWLDYKIGDTEYWNKDTETEDCQPEYWELIEEQEEQTIAKEESILLETWFEQNFLDGDKIQAGQMISSAEFFEAMCDAVYFLKNSQSEKAEQRLKELEKDRELNLKIIQDTCTELSLALDKTEELEATINNSSISIKNARGVKGDMNNLFPIDLSRFK